MRWHKIPCTIIYFITSTYLLTFGVVITILQVPFGLIVSEFLHVFADNSKQGVTPSRRYTCYDMCYYFYPDNRNPQKLKTVIHYNIVNDTCFVLLLFFFLNISQQYYLEISTTNENCSLSITVTDIKRMHQSSSLWLWYQRDKLHVPRYK